MKNDYINLRKIKIEELNKEFYLAKDVAKHWGHTNIRAAYSRNLNNSDYVLVSKSSYPNVFEELLQNNFIPKKARRVTLITEEGALNLAIRSNTKKSKEFVNTIVNEIVKAREEFGISESDFVNIIFNSYHQKSYESKTYVMIDEKSGFYKIGKSKNPKERETTLAAEIPFIKLLLISDNNIERTLHEIFKDKRVRGEWFSLSSDDIITIANDYGFKKA